MLRSVVHRMCKGNAAGVRRLPYLRQPMARNSAAAVAAERIGTERLPQPQSLRGPKRITAAPQRQIAAPARPHLSGLAPL